LWRKIDTAFSRDGPANCRRSISIQRLDADYIVKKAEPTPRTLGRSVGTPNFILSFFPVHSDSIAPSS